VSPAVRRGVALAGLAALGAAVLVAALGLPDFGHPRGPYATAVLPLTHARHVTSAVAAVTFDIRGLDTLGEELILFCAAVGATVLLRSQRAEADAHDAIERHHALADRTPASARALGAALTGPILVLGVYVVAHGQLTPGGGFQGGVVLAAAFLLAYATGHFVTSSRVEPVSLVEAAEAAGAGAYVLVALGGLVFSAAAMANFLPLGTTGELLSGGTIPVLNVAVGIEVCGAVVLILTELLDQAMLRRQGEET
jgi:multicomponent Na+:H+ antiporter subunit B